MNIEQIRAILEKQGDITIALSGNYTFDELAAGLSLYLAFKNGGRAAQIVSSKEPLVEDSSLVGIDKLNMQYQGKSGDLVVSFPYKEGEIEKISYTMENGALNIVVKAAQQGLSFDEKDVKYVRAGQAPAILVTIGVSNLSELNGVLDTNSLNGTSIVNVDIKAGNPGFGNATLISPSASSVSEEIADLLYGLGFRLDPDVSQNLLSGIIDATNNFQSPNTSGLALEMGGILIRNGAQRKAKGQNQPQRQSLSQAAPQNQNPQQQNGQQQPKTEQKNPPQDWLAPKIFKGSTNLE